MTQFRISETVYNKRLFDPNSLHDLLEFKRFRDKPSWPKGCPYALESPYTNIPELMINKIIDCHIEGLTNGRKSK